MVILKSKQRINTAKPHQWLVRLVALLTALSGVIAILQPLALRVPNRFELFLMPFNYDEINRSAAVFLGFVLIYFSSKLLQRKILAWWTAMAASIIIAFVHVFYTHSLSSALMPAMTAGILAATKQQFRVKSEPQSIFQGLRLLVLSVAIALLYGIIGFWFLEKRDFGQTFGINEAAVQTLREYSLSGNPSLIPHTRHARWFLHSLDLFGAVSVGFGIYSLFRPLAYRFSTLPSERQEAEQILLAHGDSPDDFFKLWPEDKSYFFSPRRSAFLAYRVAAGVAVVLNDPVGPPSQLEPLLKQFIDFAAANGWGLAFVDVPKRALTMFEDYNLRTLKIGEDAIIDLRHFFAQVASNKHFRNVSNRFSKEGFSVELRQPPPDRQTLNRIQKVSDQWLKQPGRQERGFALGHFSRRYLSGMPLYLARDKTNRIVAFANGIPSYHSPVATIDLMRYSNDAPNNIMDYLLLEIMRLHLDGGAQKFSLGLAPLAGTGEGSSSAVEERLLGYLYRGGGRLFSFSGLRQFKNKFEPEWEAKYLVYSGGPQNLAQVGVALSRVLKVS